MLNGGNPEGTATKFWNIASVSEDSGEITLYGDVLSKRMYDYWKGGAGKLYHTGRLHGRS